MNDEIELDPCGCCESDVPEPTVRNQPAQPSLDYRVGTHSEFLRRMIARLSQWRVPDGDHTGDSPLRDLTTRETDDPAIALLDAWSTAGDVLTFYQERIANEAFLRTATERRSILELARTIGYELGPGVAASTHLAFTVDDSDSTPDTATIPAGTQVQSIPAKDGELPQTFETAEDFQARVEWNTLKPRTTQPHPIGFGTTEAYLKGVTTGLEPGDAILFVGNERDRWPGSERWDLRILADVEPDSQADHTRVTWEPGLGHDKPTVEPADNPRIFALRRRAALFGHNAPDWRAMPDNIKLSYDPECDAEDPDRSKTQWPDFEIQTTDERLIDLDSTYPRILPGSWVALSKPGYVELYKVVEATPDSRTDFALTSKVTRLKLDAREHLSWFGLRDTAVFGQSEELEPSEKPVTGKVRGDIIELSSRVHGVEKGRPLIVTGKLDEEDDDAISEVVFVDRVRGNGTTVELQEDMAHKYIRSTVTIRANVVAATHGETVAGEVLGSGDASATHQRFKLKNAPLTYVSAPTASGRQTTLSVRVNDVQWNQVPALFSHGPDSRSYMVRIDNKAVAAVIFGDGRDGARLPTGRENVVANYRTGTGQEGEVGASTLKLLKTRPFGVRTVTNPVPASGAEDPENLEDARTNAPTTVLTLDRIVSLKDYEDYARTFAGIGKATAIAFWGDRRLLVHLSVAAVDGAVVRHGSDLYRNLVDAIDGVRDPLHTVRVDSFQPRLFNVRARLMIDPAYRWEDVQTRARAVLLGIFDFDSRGFGQPVSSAEVMTVIQRVEGVIAVDLDALYRSRASESFSPVLPAQMARQDDRSDDASFSPAELLMINAAGIVLEEWEQ